jgi:Mrp family chromosome partitioning ATPase
MTQDKKTAEDAGRMDEASRMEQEELAREQIRERMSHVKHKLLVLSGKGGVGKSTVAANLALSLVLSGHRTGLMDIDIHGPSIPTMLGLQNAKPVSTGETIEPVGLGENFKVMSIGFFLRKESDAVIWRGPLKFSLIRQFLKDVEWGDLDYLIVDSPPGTGDEPLSICQLLPGIDGAIVVTTPQDVSVIDVKKCITFCKEVKVPVLGIIENMAGLDCPHCGGHIDLFKAGGGEKLSRETGATLLGSIPIDPRIVQASDSGTSFMQRHADSPAAKAFCVAVEKVLDRLEDKP